MKLNYKTHIFNRYFAFDGEYMFLRVINKEEKNEVHMVWWHKDDYKHYGTVGQWKIKQLKKQIKK